MASSQRACSKRTAVTLALVALTAAMATAQNPQCPANCLSCQRTRSRLKRGRVPLAAIDDGDSASPKTEPLRTRCLKCNAGFTPTKSGTTCECAGGYAGDSCLKCASGDVAKPDKPGKQTCGPCPAGEVPKADGSGCVKTTDPTCSANPCGTGTMCTDGTCTPEKSCYLPIKCPPLQICGAYTSCGHVIECGECPDGKRCTADGFKCIKDEPRMCIPATQCPAGRVCGYYDDGCDGIIPCGPPELGGNCETGFTCNADGTQCVPPPAPASCVPKTTCATGKSCGTEDDGCGGKITCGTNQGNCAAGETCTITGECIVPPAPLGCVATVTKCDAAFKCGTRPNDCGKNILCGRCPAGYYCKFTKSGGVPVSSVCTPRPAPPPPPCPTTCDGGQVCGVQANEACGKDIKCGDCADGYRCADDGKSCVKVNVCPPRATCLGAWACGTEDDGCGGEVTCPTSCASGSQCNLGTCEPRIAPCMTDPAVVCDGRVCGEFADNCDGTTKISCGKCNAGSTCTFDGKMCEEPQRLCTPTATCTQQCGAQPDGCNGTLACGSCTPPAVCTKGKCLTPAKPPCKKTGESCTTSSDCCWAADNVYCDPSEGKCRVRLGGMCNNGAGACGRCCNNCGNEKGLVCALYNLPGKGCKVSARGGGGNDCGKTTICCVVFDPPIKPDANGRCAVPA